MPVSVTTQRGYADFVVEEGTTFKVAPEGDLAVYNGSKLIQVTASGVWTGAKRIDPLFAPVTAE